MNHNPSSKLNDLHQAILKQIDDLLERIRRDATNPRMGSTMQQVLNYLTPVHTELVYQIGTLQRYVRWDKFTIAFYGETNAGKSTIIETIRILLNERTKEEQRAAFREGMAKVRLCEKDLTEIEKAIEKKCSEIKGLKDKIDRMEKQFITEKKMIEEDLNRLRTTVAAKKQSMSIWRRLFLFLLSLLFLLIRSKKKIEYIELKRQLKSREEAFKQLKNREEEISAERAQINAKIKMVQIALQSLEDKRSKAKAMLEDLLKNLKSFEDGQIIGTGRPDFTPDTQSYEFQINEQRFALLDMPGIEGKEDRVRASILSAVKGAHAVFYVSSKPTPPQTGDKDKQGILEKIHEHLGDQTEVWTIFNKRITNPIQLEKSDLIGYDERAALKVLDETMRKHLGENYQGHKALSAQPAFLAVADCLVPGTDAAQSREKFLAKMSLSEVLARSNCQSFINWLSGSMLSDITARIRNANVNKVRMAVCKAASSIEQIRKEHIVPLAKAVRRDWDRVDKQLTLAVSAFGSKLQGLAARTVQMLESQIRQKVYKRIEYGISNDDLERILKTEIQEAVEEIEGVLQGQIKKEIERFQRDIKDTLERFQQRFDELQEVYRSIKIPTIPNFDPRISFGSGIDYKSLIFSALGVIGGAVVGFLTGGWVVGLAAAAIGVIPISVRIWKAMRSFFSEDYKKSQQRKEADKNIGQCVKRFQAEMESKFKEGVDRIKKDTGKIKEKVKEGVNQVEETNSEMSRVSSDLFHIADNSKAFANTNT